MPGFPGFSSRIEEEHFLVHENRLPELWFGDLNPQERNEVIRELEATLHRVRLRALSAHLGGAGLTACFLALGLLVMGIGPAEARGAFDRWVWTRASASGVAMHWAVLVLLIALGAFTADYVLRRRLRIARMWDHESTEIREAIARGKAPGPPPPLS